MALKLAALKPDGYGEALRLPKQESLVPTSALVCLGEPTRLAVAMAPARAARATARRVRRGFTQDESAKAGKT
jgi:hypothetical protein